MEPQSEKMANNLNNYDFPILEGIESSECLLNADRKFKKPLIILKASSNLNQAVEIIHY